jgi:hypothetical protein
LSTLKKHGKRLERLKFLSRCNTVALKQAGTTYRIVGNRLFVQGVKKPLRLAGRSVEGKRKTGSAYHRLYGEKEAGADR